MLAGGDTLQREKMRQAGLEGGARHAGLLEQARARRDQNLGLQGVTPEAITAAQNDPAARAELLSAMLHGQIDPRQLSGYQKDQQGICCGDQSMAAATAPGADLNLVNCMHMMREGKPVALSAIQGNTLLNTMVTPDQQAAYGGNTPTEIGLAEIMDKRASARNHDASAHLSNTKASAGGFKPDSDGTKPTQPTLPAQGAMGDVLGKVVDAESGLTEIPKAADFLAWQANKATTDPRYANGNFALQQWALQGQPPPGAVTLEQMMAGSTPAAPAAASSRKVTRTGTAPDGRRVVQYDDGTVDYAD